MHPTVPQVSPPSTTVTDYQFDLSSIFASPQQFLDHLSQTLNAPYGLATAIAMLVLGPICLIMGWKLFKAVVIVNAAIFGVVAGRLAGIALNGSTTTILICAIGGGVLLAVLAWPLMKFAVATCGALAGAFIGWAMWIHISRALGHADPNANAWVGLLIGMISLGLLAFVIFRMVIITFTALQGALMTVSGALMVLMKINQNAYDAVARTITKDPHVLPLMILLPAIIGFAFQTLAARTKSAPAKKTEPAK
jgi:hypothetical protein